MTTKEKVSQFVNAKLQNFRNVMNKPVTFTPTQRKVLEFGAGFQGGFVKAVPGNFTEKFLNWQKVPVYNPQSKAGQAGNITGNIASTAVQGMGLGKVISPLFSGVQYPLGQTASKLIAKGGATKILGKGVANLSKGIPYSASFPILNQMSENKPNAAVDVGGNLAFDVATGALPFLGVGGMVVGKNAKNFNKLMKVSGAFDNLPRAEISDLSSRVKGNFIDIIGNLVKKGETPVLADVMGHDSLYKSYPQLKLLKINLDPSYVAKDIGGSFDSVTNSIKVNPTVPRGKFRSILLHEIQHAVQEIEGFAKGGNPENLLTSLKFPKGYFDEMGKLDVLKQTNKINIGEYNKMFAEIEQKYKVSPMDIYKRTAGEIEARSTQLREGMTEAQRKAINPYDQILQKEGINRADVIVNKGGGESLNATDNLVKEARKYKSAEEFVDAKTFRDAHAAPSFDNTPVNKRMETGGDFNLVEVVKGKHNQPQDYFDERVGARYYMYDDQAGMESLTAIKNIERAVKSGNLEGKTVTTYRVVPNDVKADKLIDRDWVSFSKTYALDHGEHRFGEGAYKIIKQEVSPKDLWWDGNDIREWGFDTGKTNPPSRSELLKIFNQSRSGLTPEVNPLIAEARKYKSAEEFISSYHKVFHQTSPEAADSINKDGFKTGLEGSGYGDFLPEGINTKSTGTEIPLKGKGTQLEVFFNKNAKIKNVTNRDDAVKFIIENDKSGEYEKLLDEIDFIGRDVVRKSDALEKEFTDTRGAVRVVGERAEFFKGKGIELSKMFDDANNKMDILAQRAKKIGAKVLRDSGIDVLYIKEDVGGWTGKLKTDNFIVLDTKALKTKSQLTDIWNQSRGGESLLSDNIKRGNPMDLEKSLNSTSLKNLNEADKQAVLEEANKMLAGGLGDVGVLKNEGDVVGRYSANPSWYKSFYQANKRAPTNQEFFDMAYQKVKPVAQVADDLDLDQAAAVQNIKPSESVGKAKLKVKPEGQELAKQKLNDLINYTNRLVNEKGLSPQQAQKIGYKEGMAILEGRATLPRKVETSVQGKLSQGKLPQASEAVYPLPSTGKPLSTPTRSAIQKIGMQDQNLSGINKVGSQKQSLGQKLDQARLQAQTTNKLNQVYPSVEQIIQRTPTTVKDKAGFFEYLGTPDRFLQKIGLGRQARQLSISNDNYLDELPKEIGKVTEWSNQAPSPESAIKIFKRLDSQYANLNPTETRIAEEIKTYLAEWADRLELPKDKRITNYITHIFDDQLIKKEFDDDLAKLIQDKVAGSVYDPFTQQRLGKLGYKENVWDALDAYVKRAVRKVNMDPALEEVKKASEHLEISQFNYIKRYVDRINMRPTEVDNLLDNTIKKIIGYKYGARPTAFLSRAARQMVFRGTLGLNVGSSLRNLTQGVNTYSELGEKYTITGYANLIKKGTKELEINGVLRNNMVEDRALNATKKFWEKFDKGLFYFFDMAEKINRGSAYYGAKAKALARGATEEQAIEYGKNIVKKTQFTFGKIDTPVALQSDLIKLLTQFQSYNIKQIEFVGEKIKARDVAGLVRYGIGSLVVLETVGKLLGMDWKDLIPSIRIGFPPTLTAPFEIAENVVNDKDKYGNEMSVGDRSVNALKALIPFAPGGVQIKKTIGGIGDVSRGYAQTASGNVKYPVTQNPSNAVRGALFGGYVLPEAQQNRKDDVAPLSPKQSQSFIESGKKQSTYDIIIQRRMQTALETKIKAVAKQVKEGELTPEEGREQMRVIVDEKTIYESSSDAPKNIVSKVALYGQSLIADPSFTLEAVLEGNPLRKMSGDATVLERQKYLGTLDAGDKITEVDHIIPLSLGGTNQDSNLQFLLAEENALKASYELELLSQLKSGMINKEQAQNLIRDWRNHVDLSLLPAIAEELEKQTESTKTTKAKVKTTKAKKGKKLKVAKAPRFKKFKSSRTKLAKIKIKSLKNYSYLPKLKAPSGVSEKTLESLRNPRV